MASILTRMLKQKAVYWGPPVDDGNGGFDFPTPVEVNCRWENLEGTMMGGTSGIKGPTHDVFDKSTVFVSQDVVVDGYLLLGDLESSMMGLDPTDIPEAKKITGFQKVPNFKAREYLRIVNV